MIVRLLTVVLAGTALVSTADAQTYSIGSNPQGSLAYAAAAGVAKVASEDFGIKARVVPQGGPVVTIPLVDSGRLNFSITASVMAAFAHTGTGTFKGKKKSNFRVAASLMPLRVAWIVRADSDIKSMADLKGKRVPTKYTKQRIVGIFQWAALNTVGLGPKDVIGVPVPNGVRGIQDFMAGKTDAGNFSISSGIVRQAHAAVGGIRVLPVPDTADALSKLREIAPGTVITTVTAAAKSPGITVPTRVAESPLMLTAGHKTPDEIVYQVVKAIYHGKKKLIGVHKAYRGFNPKTINVDIGVPYHPGAMKLFKEMGL